MPDIILDLSRIIGPDESFRGIVQFEPGGAEGFQKGFGEQESIWKDNLWVLEPKFDGYRETIHLGAAFDRAYLQARRVAKDGFLSEKGLNVPHILEPLHKRVQELGWGYTIIDGEILVPGEGAVGSSRVTKILGGGPDRARDRFNEGMEAKYVAFDLPFWNGQDLRKLPYRERRAKLIEVLSELCGPHVGFADHTSGIKWQPIGHVAIAQSLTADKAAVYEFILNNGGEGCILKHVDRAYGKWWIKVKGVWTVDVVIMGFTEAKAESVKKGETEKSITKFAGFIGAVEFGVYRDGVLVKCGQASGMKDADRRAFTKEPAKWLEKVVEVKCNGWSGEAMRHPRMRNFRDDVLAIQCTFEKLMKDLEMGASGSERAA